MAKKKKRKKLKKEEISEGTNEKKEQELKKKEEAKLNETGKTREDKGMQKYIGVFAIGLVIGLIAGVALLSSFVSNSATITPEKAGQKAVDWISNYAVMPGINVELINISEVAGVYKIFINLSYGEENQVAESYITKDAEYLFPQGIPTGEFALANQEIEEEQESSEAQIEKVVRPSVDLYIWSYCPYGASTLAPFAEVASLLSESADFKVYLYYAGHGDFEVQQNKIQACIQELDYGNIYWAYAETFSNEIYEKCYGDIDCDLSESVALMNSLGINSDEVLICVEEQGEDLLEEHYNSAGEVGVTGSPSLVIDGVKVSTSRTAEAFKEAVCSRYIEAPEECNSNLDSTGNTASGSC
jgi:flagellar basal body-associated protein FliL